VSIRAPESASSSDHLGPPARNWDEVSERARIHFDVHNEEWARRQSLHENYGQNGILEDQQAFVRKTSSQTLSESLSTLPHVAAEVPRLKPPL
jgi:hypothetical protein